MAISFMGILKWKIVCSAEYAILVHSIVLKSFMETFLPYNEIVILYEQFFMSNMDFYI